MLQHTFTFRVRYADTDKMGYLYYGRYAEYLEMARVEMMRHYGIIYKEMEDNNIMMPVLEMSIKYKRPAYYDDIIQIQTIVKEKPGTRMHFEYKWLNPSGKIMTEAETLLCFVNMTTNKPCLPSPDIQAILEAHFKSVD